MKRKGGILINKRMAGIGLPAAIFLITLMAVIVVVINRIVSQNAQGYEEEINLTRSFFAAQSGAGFAMNGIYPPEEYSGYAGTICAGTPGAPITYNFEVDGQNSCTAEVHCTVVTVSSRNFATIESTGSCGDLERTIQVRTVY